MQLVLSDVVIAGFATRLHFDYHVIKKGEVMKKTFFLFIVLGLLPMVASCVVSSQEPVYHERSAYNNEQGMFYERIESQQRRINQGIKSHELTRKEAGVLQDNLSWIRDRYARMTTDGRLTQNEQKRLDKMLDKNNEMIKNKKRSPIKRVY